MREKQVSTYSKSRDVEYEKFLDQSGLTWRYLESFDLSKIEREGTNYRQVRLGQAEIDEDHVFVLAQALEAGEKLPPIVVSGGPERFEVPCGKHRVACFDLVGITNHDAYEIIDADLDDLRILALRDNLRHGKSVPVEERLAHAKHLVDSESMPIKEAAKLCGLKTGKLQVYINGEKTKNELLDAGLSSKEVSRLSKTHFVHLHRIPRLPHKMRLAKILSRVQVGAEELNEVIKKTRSATSDVFADKVLDEFESSPSIRRALKRSTHSAHRVKAVISPAQQTEMLLGSVLKCDFGLADMGGLTAQQRENMMVSCRAASKRIGEIYALLATGHLKAV